MTCSQNICENHFKCSIVAAFCLPHDYMFCPTQEVDDFFEQEKTFLLDYYSKIKDSTAKAEKMTRAHKSMYYITM